MAKATAHISKISLALAMCFVLLLAASCGNEESSAGSESGSNRSNGSSGSSDLVAASYDDWDVDGNGEIAYDEWDADAKDYIDETEFSERA